MYVNVNNGERLNFGETAKTSTRRRFSGVILFLYHHDNLYIHARREDFSLGLAGGGGGVQAQTTGKRQIFFICFVSPQFILQRASISKKTIIQL